MKELTRAMERLICLECPNGCNLQIEFADQDTLCVSGNRCEKGPVFAARVLREQGRQIQKIRVNPPENPKAAFSGGLSRKYSRQVLSDVLSGWGKELKSVKPHFFIDGSPERSLFRTVVETQDGQLIVLEKIPRRAVENKIKIAQSLEYLSGQKLSKIQSVIRTTQGDFLQSVGQDFWQASPYVQGEPLDRENYIFDSWRGEVLGEFLCDFKRAAKELTALYRHDRFSIKTYIEKLFHQVKIFEPRLVESVTTVIRFLDRRFYLVHDSLPVAFCHGDYHPLNIVWKGNDILCVIDWEFSGVKPEIYDLANMIGCVGMENPECLAQGLIKGFVARMQSSGLIAQESWDILLEFIISMRFAWLSEWLRKSDEEMIELEIVYMKLLIERAGELKQAWGLLQG